jgi:hypothetical protein
MTTTNLIKRALRSVGLEVTRRDRLAEQIPSNYLRSPYLPPIYRESLGRVLYFGDMFDRVKAVPGDLVECGVSIGEGILAWSLLSDLSGVTRDIFGFDSFQGFPGSLEADRKTDGSFHTARGDYASPPELVMKLLEHGRVAPSFAAAHVHLVRGFFEDTLDRYDGTIALLHLDCDLYESYMTCLRRLYSRVHAGGLILFDEYDNEAFPGARRAIEEFFADKPERIASSNTYGYLKYHVVKA